MVDYGGTVSPLLACIFYVPVSCLSRRVNSLVPTHSFTTTKFLFKSNFTNSLAGLLLFIVCSFDIKTMICYFLASHDICNIFNSTCTRLVESHFLSWAVPTSSSYRTWRGRWCSGLRSQEVNLMLQPAFFPSRAACASSSIADPQNCFAGQNASAWSSV